MNLDLLKFDEKELIPIIVQNAEDGQVLMFAYGTRSDSYFVNKLICQF